MIELQAGSTFSSLPGRAPPDPPPGMEWRRVSHQSGSDHYELVRSLNPLAGAKWIEGPGLPARPPAPADMIWLRVGGEGRYREYEMRERPTEEAPQRAPTKRAVDIGPVIESAKREGMYLAGLTLVLVAYREAQRCRPPSPLPYQIRAGLLAAGMIGESE
jgi:hypothetical protein